MNKKILTANNSTTRLRFETKFKLIHQWSKLVTEKQTDLNEVHLDRLIRDTTPLIPVTEKLDFAALKISLLEKVPGEISAILRIIALLSKDPPARKLEDQVAVVLGGSAGIGLAVAKRYLEEGAKVTISGRRVQVVETMALELQEDTLGFSSDINDSNSTQKLLEDTVARRGKKIDVLFINAGGGASRSIEESDKAFLNDLFQTNFFGTYNAVQAALPWLNDGARIVLNASVSSVKCPVPGISGYAASKAAVASLPRSFSKELLPRGIRVNAVSPGLINTPGLNPEKLPYAELEKRMQVIIDQIPMGRMAESEEIASVVLFLSTQDSSYLVGQNIIVDGGLSSV